MENFLPGLITGFREGLEAFLIVSILLRYISKTKKLQLKKYIYYGTVAGIAASAAFGGVLVAISGALEGAGSVDKIWESIASIVALGLVTTFIVWMINNASSITDEIEGKVSANLSGWGVFWVSAVMIAREGAEIAVFSFTGQYTGLSIFTGVAAALLLSVLIYFSLVRVNLKTVFTITLAYLILQAGFLLGYGIHEGLSALKDAGILASQSPWLVKVFDLSKTVLDHKQGALGVPLYAVFGWYSKPEWIQFAAQYIYTVSIFLVWLTRSKNTIKEKM